MKRWLPVSILGGLVLCCSATGFATENDLALEIFGELVADSGEKMPNLVVRYLGPQAQRKPVMMAKHQDAFKALRTDWSIEALARKLPTSEV